MRSHFGDPCIHCDIGHDDVSAGSCTGPTDKAIPIRYRSLGVRWDNVEHFLVLMSNGDFLDRWYHISEHAFTFRSYGPNRPEYDAELRRS